MCAHLQACLQSGEYDHLTEGNLFADILQTRKRATIIGEMTSGGPNPGASTDAPLRNLAAEAGLRLRFYTTPPNKVTVWRFKRIKAFPNPVNNLRALLPGRFSWAALLIWAEDVSHGSGIPPKG